MKTIVLTNAEGTFNAQYKTDLIGMDGNFTIMEKKKDDDLETKIGIGFTDTMYSVDDFKKIAQDHNLDMALSDGGSYEQVVNESVELEFDTESLDGGSEGVAYEEEVSATGGSGKYSFSLEEGSALPAGLSISQSGVISGTPTEAETATFTIVLTDSFGTSLTKEFSITISA